MNSSRPDDIQRFDLVVIGGGITGLGIARAAAEGGFRTALIERSLIGSGTSANSLRIIHGGFRYLQSLNIPRVLRSLQDQARVAREFADLVTPLPCYLPLEKSGLKSRWPLTAAALIYRTLGILCDVKVPPSSVIDETEAERSLAILKGRVPHGAFLWTDYQLVNPGELHQRLSTLISKAGGSLFEQVEVARILRNDDLFRVELVAGPKELAVSARVVVNAAGSEVSRLAPESSTPAFTSYGWCRGFNLVFEGNPYGVFGAGFPGERGRLYFVTGREDEIAIGTEYLPMPADGAGLKIPEQELEACLASMKSVIPELKLDRSRLLRVEAGILPTTEKSPSSPEGALVGAPRFDDANGFISVLSTKYTTFLSQADHVLKLASKYLR